MKRCFIFSAGTFYGMRQWPAQEDLIIAADAGFLTCQRMGITPTLLLGDFDSMDEPTDFSNIERSPVEKDDTDTMLALKKGLSYGCQEFFIYGATGGKRLDHTLANLQSLLFLRRQGARGWLYDDDFVWTVIEDEALSLKKEVDWGLFSAFCLGDQAVGVDEEGFQYHLQNGTLHPDLPIGVSNHFMEPEATVRVGSGALLVGWELPPIKTQS